MSAPWQGLGMKSTMPLAVRADVNSEALSDPAYVGCWPRYSHITWEFPGVEASGGKPFTMEWFSGFSDVQSTPAEFLPPEVCHEVCRKAGVARLPYEGRVIEGEAGYMLVPHGGDQKLRPSLVMKGGRSAPVLPAVDAAPNHFEEFAARCLGGGSARSDFAWSSRMMDAVLLGGVAERMPGRRHVWNDAIRAFDTSEATALLKSSYRSGWEIQGV